MGTFELEFIDEHGWLVDPVTRFAVYIGPVSVTSGVGNGTLFGMVGTFKVGQDFPFPIRFPAASLPPMPDVVPVPILVLVVAPPAEPAPAPAPALVPIIVPTPEEIRLYQTSIICTLGWRLRLGSPLMGTFELEFIDEHGWLVDPVTRFAVYIGPVSVTSGVENGTLFGMVGTVKVGQDFPFPIIFPAASLPPMPDVVPIPILVLVVAPPAEPAPAPAPALVPIIVPTPEED